VAPYIYAVNWLAINFSPETLGIGPLFQKLYVRQALQMGIPEKSIITALYKGLGVPIYQMRRKTPSFRAEISGADPVGVNPGCLVAQCIAE